MKTLAITLAVFTAIVSFSAGCKNGNPPGSQDSLAVDTVVFDPTPECQDLPPKHFCWAGLDFIMLGDSLTWKQFEAPEGGVFKDTVFSDTLKSESSEQITDWNARLLTFAAGRVVMEADFETGQLLNRIRIETPEYRLKNGLGLGSTAADVLKAYEGEALLVTPFEQYNVMELIRPVMHGNVRRTVTFHFPLGTWFQAGQNEYTPKDIPATAKVSRIVVL